MHPGDDARGGGRGKRLETTSSIAPPSIAASPAGIPPGCGYVAASIPRWCSLRSTTG